MDGVEGLAVGRTKIPPATRRRFYVLDLYCDSEKLAVELDGEVHKNDNAFDSDAERTAWLRRMGIKVIRIENYLVFRELEYVLHFIQSHFGWHDREAHTTSNSPP